MFDVADHHQHHDGRAAPFPRITGNVAKVLRLSRTTTFLKIIVPATLPYMFTGYRLSLGIAWLVIVASEMLTGAPGVGGFPSGRNTTA